MKVDEMPQVVDDIGVGFGPANGALAVALEEFGVPVESLFLERQPASHWHPGMLLNGTDMQRNPLRDLVTPRNLRSRYSFINDLHEHGHLDANDRSLPYQAGMEVRIEVDDFVLKSKLSQNRRQVDCDSARRHLACRDSGPDVATLMARLDAGGTTRRGGPDGAGR